MTASTDRLDEAVRAMASGAGDAAAAVDSRLVLEVQERTNALLHTGRDGEVDELRLDEHLLWNHELDELLENPSLLDAVAQAVFEIVFDAEHMLGAEEAKAIAMLLGVARMDSSSDLVAGHIDAARRALEDRGVSCPPSAMTCRKEHIAQLDPFESHLASANDLVHEMSEAADDRKHALRAQLRERLLQAVAQTAAQKMGTHVGGS